MGVAPPPPVPAGVLERVRSDMRSQRAARGLWPPGELSFSFRRTREFQLEPLPLLLRAYERYGPVFSLRLLYAPIVFALGPEVTIALASKRKVYGFLKLNYEWEVYARTATQGGEFSIMLTLPIGPFPIPTK